MKRPTLIVLGAILLAGVGAATFMAASYQPATRSAELENFHLVGASGRSYSIESFPTGSVLAIYFGYTTCLRACPTALNDLAEAIDRIWASSALLSSRFSSTWIPTVQHSLVFLRILRLSAQASSVSPVRPTTSSKLPRALRSGLSAPLLVLTRPTM